MSAQPCSTFAEWNALHNLIDFHCSLGSIKVVDLQSRAESALECAAFWRARNWIKKNNDSRRPQMTNCSEKLVSLFLFHSWRKQHKHFIRGSCSRNNFIIYSQPFIIKATTTACVKAIPRRGVFICVCVCLLCSQHTRCSWKLRLSLGQILSNALAVPAAEIRRTKTGTFALPSGKSSRDEIFTARWWDPQKKMGCARL